MRSRTPAEFLAALVLIALGGCADFDRADRLEDLRVLAVRTEPAEVLIHPFFGFLAPGDRPPPPFFTAPSYPVEIETFAYDPRGGLLRAETRLCPDGQRACVDFDLAGFLEREPEEARDDLLSLYSPRIVEEELPPADEDPAGRISQLRYEVRLTPAIIDSIVPDIEGQPVPNFFPYYPRIAVQVHNDSVEDVTRETGFKRLPVGIDLAHPDLPAQLRDGIGQAFGVRICDEVIPDDEFEEGPGECFEPRPPNRNPQLLGFDLDAAEDLRGLRGEDVRMTSSPDLGLGSLLRAQPGAVLHLTPVFAENDVQHYQVLSFNIEDSTLRIQNRFEDYVASWYSTAGETSTSRSNVQFNRRLGVTWQLPTLGVEPGDRDALIVVVRDQRGGTSVAQVVVEYR
jgi:hypothetical protein